MNDETFRALGDPTRRKILRLLGDGEMTAGEIASHFAMAAPSVSHHFGVLKQSGLISGRKEGQQIYYSLNTTIVQDAVTVLLDLLGNRESGEPK